MSRILPRHECLTMLKKLLNRRIKLSWMVIAFYSTFAINTIANAEETLPIFANITLNRQFSPDPMIVRGMSGGSELGRQIAGKKQTPTGPCAGFTDIKPDYTLVLSTKFHYLKLVVESSQDTTLIIQGPVVHGVMTILMLKILALLVNG